MELNSNLTNDKNGLKKWRIKKEMELAIGIKKSQHTTMAISNHH